MIVLAIVIFSLLLVLSAIGLALGLRGRRVDDHPLCRRCGFDLTGRAEGSTQCAECGDDLSRPKAIRVGHRERRRWLLWTSGVPLVVCGFVFTLAVVVIVRKVSPIEYAPMWWLERGVVGSDAVLRGHAMRELQRRMGLQGATGQSFGRVIDKVLDIQGDATRLWAPAWGDFVEDARRKGMLTEAQGKRYFSQLLRIKFKSRAQVRAGARVPLSVKMDVRGGSRRSYPELRYQIHSRSMDGQSKSWKSGSELPRDFTTFLEPLRGGETIYQGFAALRPRPRAGEPFHDAPEQPPADALWALEFVEKFRPVIGDDPVEPVTDFSMLADGPGALEVSGETGVLDKVPKLSVVLSADMRDAVFSYEVYVVTPSANLKLTDCVLEPGHGRFARRLETMLREPLPEEALKNPKLLLVPWVEGVRKTVDHSRYLDVPLEVTGFRVTKGSPSTPPSTKVALKPTTRPDPSTTRPWLPPWR